MKVPFDTHAIAPREYRHAKSFIRQDGYVYAGLLITALFLAYLGSDPANGISGMASILGFGLMALFAADILMPRLLVSQRWRIDSEGIHELRWRSKRTIPWAAFSEGKVWRSRSEGELTFKSDSGDDVRIWLYLLEEVDRREILDLVNQVWLPPAIAMPSEPVVFTIEHQGIRRPWAMKTQWSSEGIYLGRGSQFISWSAITEAFVIRAWRGQQGFCQLELRYPNGSFWLQDSCFVEAFHGFGLNFQGVEATTLLRFLREHAPKERLHIGYLNGEPQSTDDREAQRRCIGFSLIVLTILFAFLASAFLFFIFLCDCEGASRLDIDFLPIGMRLSLMAILVVFLLACTLAIGLGLHEYVKLLRRYLRLCRQ